MSRKALLGALALLLALASHPTFVAAQPLDSRIPRLFGGVFQTSISPRALEDAQRPLVLDRFRSLAASLAVARSNVPVPSASGAFRFEFDDEQESYVRREQSLGSTVAERAETLGRRTWLVSFSSSHMDFDTLEGSPLRRLQSRQPALSDSFLAQLPADDRERAANATLETQLALRFAYDLFFLGGTWGVTDDLDLSLALSVNRARMRGVASATIEDPDAATEGSGAYFTTRQQGVCESFLCANDRFRDSAFGSGDVYLRAKWRALRTPWADLAVAGLLTLPTGNARNYLGFHNPTFTPWFIAAKPFGRIEPHLNLGYAFRSGRDVSQAMWVLGADVLVTPWLTTSVDFLGFHDDRRDNISDDILQSAFGLKLNPVGRFVLGLGVQLPLNRDGLRADVIWTSQAELTF